MSRGARPRRPRNMAEELQRPAARRDDEAEQQAREGFELQLEPPLSAAESLPGLLGDSRLAHKSASSVRRDLVARYVSVAGNKAARAILQRRSARAAAEDEPNRLRAGAAMEDEAVRHSSQQGVEEDNPIVETTMNFGPAVNYPHWGSMELVDRPNPFASGALQEQERPADRADVQRQDAAAGGVFFHVTSFSAAVAGGLNVSENAAGASLSSNHYSASGTVKAVGPKQNVAKWDVGFLQTVYRSDRNFHWASGVRSRRSDRCAPLPVRDGDALKQPWYGLETVVGFSAATSDTQTSTMDDTPGTSRQPWKDPHGAGGATEPDSLHHTDGMDIFRSWLAVRNRTDFHKLYLRFADWQVNYATAVDVTKAVGSRVTPGGGSGAKVTGTGKGMGGKQPALFDPVANDVARDVDSTW